MYPLGNLFHGIMYIMSETFWLKDPSVLLNKKYIFDVFPREGSSFISKLNAVSRMVFILTFLGFIMTRNMNILVSGAATIMAILVLHHYKKDDIVKESLANMTSSLNMAELKEDIHKEINEEEYTMPTVKNPLMNALPGDNPKRAPAAPSYNKNVDEQIKDTTDQRLFADLGDNIAFDRCMRNFYTMPSTTTPNDQKEFAEFCYGDMYSKKEALFQ